MRCKAIHYLTLPCLTLPSLDLSHFTICHVPLRYFTLLYLTLRYVTLHYISPNYTAMRFTAFHQTTLQALTPTISFRLHVELLNKASASLSVSNWLTLRLSIFGMMRVDMARSFSMHVWVVYVCVVHDGPTLSQWLRMTNMAPCRSQLCLALHIAAYGNDGRPSYEASAAECVPAVASTRVRICTSCRA